jgi:hypothetical protein
MLPKTGEPLRQSFRYRFTGTNTGAPLSLTKNTTDFAGLALLTFRLTTETRRDFFCQADSEPHRTVLLRHDDLSVLGFQGRDEALRIGLEERERAVMARDDGFELEVPLHG